MKAISLFSGAMGLDLGMEKAGFDVLVCNEFDPVICETIRKNSKTPLIEGDISKISSYELLKAAKVNKGEQIDLVFGGPPCQAFSTAGAQRSMKDVRGNLVLDFLRIIKDIRPNTFLLENVRGLMYAKIQEIPKGFKRDEYNFILNKKGGVLYFLSQEFQKLGYKISFALFNSANYGVPQKRERILFFGTLSKKEITLPVPTHDLTGINGLKWLSIREAFAGLNEKDMEYVEFRDNHKQYLSKLKEGQYWKYLSKKDQEKALGKSLFLQGGKTGFFRRLAWNSPAPTLVTSPIMPATMLCHPDKLRPLSVQEYARIQQFPDSWKFEGKTLQKYKQIGNAVPVGLAYPAGMALARHLKGKDSGSNSTGFNYSRYNGTDHVSFLDQFSGEISLQKKFL